MIEKKETDKRFIKTWRPVSLFSVDYKTVSKALAARLKDILPKTTSSEQSACVTNKFIGENGKLISDISKVAIFESYIVEVEIYIVAMDLERAFDSLTILV